ncbi:uncharacterized protein [Notothenia coriiceps]|uniref:Uncharacterized protein n=1 Tax=Notothenia coriiceps TaxID=8208 RepID=A0A6I9MJW5_9TELE|nr:PREDICTED: uncharacterized protein LOC104941378 [Notothenia coriiceps]
MAALPGDSAPASPCLSMDLQAVCQRGMERLGLLRMPPMEPLVAAHLLPRLARTPSRNPTLPVKADRFQSAMTERAYKAAALSDRALNISSLLTAYQAELCEDLSSKPGPAVWDEIAAITDICLRVQRCAVQATGKVMGIMVVQERARWLNLTDLPARFKIPKQQRPQPAPSPQPRQETRTSWPRKSPVPAAAVQAQPTQIFSHQSRKKKRAA